MPQTILDRAIEALEKIRFAEAQDVLNELRTLKLQSLSKSNVTQMKISVLKAAHKEASKAYVAMEGLDAADDLLAFVGLLNQEIAEQQRADD